MCFAAIETGNARGQSKNGLHIGSSVITWMPGRMGSLNAALTRIYVTASQWSAMLTFHTAKFV